MGGMLGSIGRDVRWGIRALARRPLYALLAVLTLGLGIGVNTAIFSLLDGALLRPLPFPDSGRLMQVVLRVPANQFFPGQEPRDMVWSHPKFETFRDAQEVFEGVALYRDSELNLTGVEQPESLRAEWVGPGYLEILRTAPLLGRPFSAEEESAPGTPVALIGHELWLSRFGGDRGVLEETVELDLVEHRIVGVMPRGFRGLTGNAQVWVPLERLGREVLDQPQSHSFSLVGRLETGVTPQQAHAEIERLGALVHDAFQPRVAAADPWSAQGHFLEEIRTDAGLERSIWLLFAAVSFFLLLVCVNLAGLVLARAMERQREIAVRMSLGAGRWRVARQLVVENLLLAALGGALGLLVAGAGAGVLARMAPQTAQAFRGSLQPLTAIGFALVEVDLRVVLFAASVSLLTAVGFGLLPALKASGVDLSRSLKATGAASDGRSLARWRRWLVSIEVALALVLVSGAGLTMRSLGQLYSADMGFDAEGVLTLRVKLPQQQYDPPRARDFFQEFEREVAALPGIEAAGFNICTPLSAACNGTVAVFPDRPEVPRGQEPPVGMHYVDDGYFQALKIPLIRGEWFGSRHPDGPKVVLVNQTAAREFWPGEDPVGRPVQLYSGGFHTGATVIGVVGDVRYEGLATPPEAAAYVPLAQSPRTRGFLFVRAQSPRALAPAIAEVLRRLDPNLPMTQVLTMDDRVRAAADRTRFLSGLLGLFAALALGLSALGLYGVMSYLVGQKTREIGLRQALGAQKRDILRHVMGHSLTPLAAGIVGGGSAALLLGRWLEPELYQVRAFDPVTMALAAAVILATGLAAGFLPARRASKLEPMTALRYE